MKMIDGRACMLVVAVAVAACDPGIRFQGRVLDASGNPIAGADARIVCEGTVSHKASMRPATSATGGSATSDPSA